MNRYVGAMSTFIPAAKKGNWAIEHFTMTKAEVDFEKMRGAFRPGGYREVYDLVPGNYVRLVWNGYETVMSDTPMELRTQEYEARRAKGDCLVGGLGLGIFILKLQEKPEVNSILVVEKDQDIIDLVQPNLPLTTKVTILKGDIFEKDVVDRTQRFDFIYFDIWANICGDNAPEVGRLKRRYRPLLRKENPEAWIGAWREEDFAYHHRQNR